MQQQRGSPIKDNTIQEFASLLLEEAKRFLEKADEQSGAGETANLHAALMLGFSALEAHIAGMSAVFGVRTNITIHERSILEEREVKLENGAFELSGRQMVRLDDRIQFLHYQYSGKKIDRNATWWGDLMSAVKLRNELTHPKGATIVSKKAVASALEAIIDTINVLFKAVYKKKLPAASRGLQSRLRF